MCVCSSALLLLPLPLCHPRSHVYPILSSILQLTPPPLLSSFSFPSPVGVVEGHRAHWLTFTEERGRVKQEKGRGEQ